MGLMVVEGLDDGGVCLDGDFGILSFLGFVLMMFVFGNGFDDWRGCEQCEGGVFFKFQVVAVFRRLEVGMVRRFEVWECARCERGLSGEVVRCRMDKDKVLKEEACVTLGFPGKSVFVARGASSQKTPKVIGSEESSEGLIEVCRRGVLINDPFLARVTCTRQ